MKRKISWVRTIERNIYIHSDLRAVASSLKEKIEKRICCDELEGISLEIMSCLVMHAFSFEANINFIGWYIFKGKWCERAKYKVKIKK